jgi:outer membrane murein-binding lipoprotein Lpp
MSRRNRDGDSRDARASEREPQATSLIPSGAVRYLTLIGVGVLIFMNAKLLGLQGSISQLDARVAQISQKVDNYASRAAQAQQAQQRPQGPDPNKVYPIKLQGSPSEGPENAPITIAEFSDFQ